MLRFFNSVYENDVERLDHDCFNLETCRIDCFGFFPRFQLNDRNRVFVVQADPMNGIWGRLMGMLFPWKDKNPIEVFLQDKDEGSTFIPLYSFRAQLGSKIYGCIIPRSRIDTFHEVLRKCDGQVHKELGYTATIRAIIEPIKFYNFLKTQANSDQLKSAIEECLLKRIDNEYQEHNGDPDFTIENYSFSTAETENAGYNIETCTIRYTRMC